jgi:uncharacterized protein (TIGR02594 family)
MTKVPEKYAYLTKAPKAPMMVTEGLKFYGLLEGKGVANNPIIVGWADEVFKLWGIPYTKWAADWYNKDSIPWCGLFMAMLAVRSDQGHLNRMPPVSYLSALAWAGFGHSVQFKGKEGYRLKEIEVGDVAVFVRDGGGHVALVVAVSENGKTLHVLGGNQSDSVNITEIGIDRLYAIRRPNYRIKPEGARHVTLTSSGVVSTNEA